MMLDHLASLLNIIEETGVWPAALCEGILSLITKGEGTSPLKLRPIGVMSRLFIVCGLPLVCVKSRIGKRHGLMTICMASVRHMEQKMSGGDRPCKWKRPSCILKACLDCRLITANALIECLCILSYNLPLSRGCPLD